MTFARLGAVGACCVGLALPLGLRGHVPDEVQGGAASISGVVVDQSQRDVPGAHVGLATIGGDVARATADEQGLFALTGIPAGRYFLSAASPGYGDGYYGQVAIGGPSGLIDLADGQRLEHVRLPLWKLGSISGRLNDEAGEPAVGLDVYALARAGAAARWTAVAKARTDDRGLYRLALLRPGAYLVAVPSARATIPADLAIQLAPMFQDTSTVDGMQVRGFNTLAPPARNSQVSNRVYPTTYYAAARTTADAGLIDLAYGAEVTADVQLNSVAAFDVRGTLVGPPLRATHALVQLMPIESGRNRSVADFEAARTVSDSQGRFMFSAVPEGLYELRSFVAPWPGEANVPPEGILTALRDQALDYLSMTSDPTEPIRWGWMPPAPAAESWYVSQLVSVDHDLTSVVATMNHAPRISGTVVFSGQHAPPGATTLKHLNVTAVSVDGAYYHETRPAWVTVDDMFANYGVVPGQYTLDVIGDAAPWRVASITASGHDCRNRPVDVESDLADVVITFSDKETGVSGVVRKASGEPDGSGMVVAFPAQQADWQYATGNSRFVQSARTGTDGTYEIVDLPEGDYFVVAVPLEDAFDIHDVSLFSHWAPLATKTHVTVASIQRLDLTSVRQ